MTAGMRPLVVLRGGGDLATGVAWRLQRAGFRIAILELAQPRAVRRAVSAAQAVFAGSHTVEGLRFVAAPHSQAAAFATGQPWAGIVQPTPAASVSANVDVEKSDAVVPVFIDEHFQLRTALNAHVLIDARLKKRGIDTRLEMAPLVVGLGPGFVVGQHCHAVVETQRGHTLGRVYAAQGAAALADTGIPEAVAGHAGARVLRAPCSGELLANFEIGALLEPGAVVCTVAGQGVSAPFAGVLRGLLQSGLQVAAGEKIGDVDPRSNPAHCFMISDKALAIAGGVLEAVLHASSQ